MKITDEQKQRILACHEMVAATATTTSAFAAAGTLCIYAGASAVDTGVTLLISSACTGAMIEAYTNLANDLPLGPNPSRQRRSVAAERSHRVNAAVAASLRLRRGERRTVRAQAGCKEKAMGSDGK